MTGALPSHVPASSLPFPYTNAPHSFLLRTFVLAVPSAWNTFPQAQTPLFLQGVLFAISLPEILALFMFLSLHMQPPIFAYHSEIFSIEHISQSVVVLFASLLSDSPVRRETLYRWEPHDPLPCNTLGAKNGRYQ